MDCQRGLDQQSVTGFGALQRIQGVSAVQERPGGTRRLLQTQVSVIV